MLKVIAVNQLFHVPLHTSNITYGRLDSTLVLVLPIFKSSDKELELELMGPCLLIDFWKRKLSVEALSCTNIRTAMLQ